MSRRHILSLAVAAVVLVVLMFVLDASREGSGPDDDGLFLPDLGPVANALAQVTLRGKEDGDVVTLIRSGDRWVVDERDDYPADLGKLRPLVLALAEARIVEQKTANPEFYDRLGVDDPMQGGSGTRVALVGDGFTYTVILGDTAQGSYRYARLADEAQSVLIDKNPDAPTVPTDWLVSAIIDVPADQVRKVTLRHADGEQIIIEKESAEQTDFTVTDIPDGRALSYPSVANPIGGVLANLTLEDVRPETDSEPVATAVFETFEGGTLTLTVRRESDEGAEVDWVSFDADPDVNGLQARTAGWAYRLPVYKKNQLVRRWDDLLKSEGTE